MLHSRANKIVPNSFLRLQSDCSELKAIFLIVNNKTYTKTSLIPLRLMQTILTTYGSVASDKERPFNVKTRKQSKLQKHNCAKQKTDVSDARKFKKLIEHFTTFLVTLDLAPSESMLSRIHSHVSVMPVLPTVIRSFSQS